MAAAPDPRLQEVLLDLARTLVTTYDIGDILDRLCDHTVELLPVAGAGVMLLEPARHADDAVQRAPVAGAGDRRGEGAPRLLTVAASDSRVHAIERLQIELAEGPCLDAWRTGKQVLASDLVTSEAHWPHFAPAAVHLGMKAVHSFPLCFDGRAIGAVNLFSEDPVLFTADQADLAQLLGDIATAYVLNARQLGTQTTMATQLQHALDSRVVIEQAKGKLSERLEVDVDSAFERMRAFARARGLRLREVARGVVEGSIDVTAGR